MQGRIFDKEMMKERVDKEWEEVGKDTHWECIRCGECCRRHWSVDITWIEFRRLVNDPDIKFYPDFKKEVHPETGMDHPYFMIVDRCPYLKGSATCSLHPGWFYTCATYPFLLTPEGKLLYHSQCRGIGYGDIVDPEKMKRRIMKERKKAGMIIPDE